MIDLKRESPKEQKVVEASEPSYPSLSLYNVKNLPLGDSDVGKKFTITAEVIVRRVAKTSDKEGSRDEAQLDFINIDFAKRKGKEDLAKSLKE